MKDMEGILGTQRISQVGIIVNDIETAKKDYAAFLDTEIPDHVDGGTFDVTGTVYRGQDAPEANCHMAFFDIGDGVQLELIEPNGKPSAWQEYLDTYGEGIHHLAFNVEDMATAVKACEAFGMTVIQHGKYGSGDGEYTYLDARSRLKCYIELLQNY